MFKTILRKFMTMTSFTDDQIENAFIRIRAEFEKRGNEEGLEILDKCEKRWDATGSLSHRQHAWLQRQLDGTWKRDAEPDKIVVDPEKLDQLEKAIDDLQRTVKAMR